MNWFESTMLWFVAGIIVGRQAARAYVLGREWRWAGIAYGVFFVLMAVGNCVYKVWGVLHKIH